MRQPAQAAQAGVAAWPCSASRAGGGPARAAIVLGCGQFLFGVGLAVYGINQVSLRQVITPARTLGRMNASLRFVVTGAVPLGAILGGALGDLLGLRPALIVGALGGFLGPLWLLRSPIRSLCAMPTPTDAG